MGLQLLPVGVGLDKFVKLEVWVSVKVAISLLNRQIAVAELVPLLFVAQLFPVLDQSLRVISELLLQVRVPL